MKQRIIGGALLLLGIVVAVTGARATSGTHTSPVRQWAIVNFARTTQVNGYALNAGQYLIVHDFEKMDRGDPCTSIYSFGESGQGPQQEAVTFMCIPKQKAPPAETTLALDTVAGDTLGCTFSWGWSMDRLKEYQFAGDTEAHGVPETSARSGSPLMHEGH